MQSTVRGIELRNGVEFDGIVLFRIRRGVARRVWFPLVPFLFRAPPPYSRTRVALRDNLFLMLYG